MTCKSLLHLPAKPFLPLPTVDNGYLLNETLTALEQESQDLKKIFDPVMERDLGELRWRELVELTCRRFPQRFQKWFLTLQQNPNAAEFSQQINNETFFWQAVANAGGDNLFFLKKQVANYAQLRLAQKRNLIGILGRVLSATELNSFFQQILAVPNTEGTLTQLTSLLTERPLPPQIKGQLLAELIPHRIKIDSFVWERVLQTALTEKWSLPKKTINDNKEVFTGKYYHYYQNAVDLQPETWDRYSSPPPLTVANNLAFWVKEKQFAPELFQFFLYNIEENNSLDETGWHFLREFLNHRGNAFLNETGQITYHHKTWLTFLYNYDSSQLTQILPQVFDFEKLENKEINLLENKLKQDLSSNSTKKPWQEYGITSVLWGRLAEKKGQHQKAKHCYRDFALSLGEKKPEEITTIWRHLTPLGQATVRQWNLTILQNAISYLPNLEDKNGGRRGLLLDRKKRIFYPPGNVEEIINRLKLMQQTEPPKIYEKTMKEVLNRLPLNEAYRGVRLLMAKYSGETNHLAQVSRQMVLTELSQQSEHLFANLFNNFMNVVAEAEITHQNPLTGEEEQQLTSLLGKLFEDYMKYPSPNLVWQIRKTLEVIEKTGHHTQSLIVLKKYYQKYHKKVVSDPEIVLHFYNTANALRNKIRQTKLF